MRVRPLLLPTVLAACSPAAPDRAADAGGAPAVHARAAVADDAVPCGVGAAPPAQRCSVERTMGAQGAVLTLRRPDGGFRRLLIARDGRGVVAADGAAPARVTIVGPGRIDVAIGDERYVLPATIRR